MNAGTGSDFPSGAPVLTSIFSRVRVTQYLVLYVVCRPLFVFIMYYGGVEWWNIKILILLERLHIQCQAIRNILVKYLEITSDSRLNISMG
jgi:hypothetical protein